MKAMKKKLRKFLLMLSCGLLLMSLSVGVTVAYLTSTDTVTNTFTVGNVTITMDEADVYTLGEDGATNENHGKPIEGAARVDGNKYHLLPGRTYTKDPTIHVGADSEDAYVRMLVTVEDHDNLVAVLSACKPELVVDGVVLLQNMVDWNQDWEYVGTTAAGENMTYEFRYNRIVTKADANVPALFTQFTLPGEINTDNLPKLANMKIVAVAHAIQADGFANSAAAWGAWK